MTGQATIVSTYSHIFNTRPRLTPTTLVLDDAHAAEGFVAGNWSLSIERGHPVYRPLLELIAGEVDPERVADLRNDALSPYHRPAAALVGPASLAENAEELLAVLDAHIAAGDSASYPLSELRGHLAGCLLYVAG